MGIRLAACSDCLKLRVTNKSSHTGARSRPWVGCFGFRIELKDLIIGRRLLGGWCGLSCHVSRLGKRETWSAMNPAVTRIDFLNVISGLHKRRDLKAVGLD